MTDIQARLWIKNVDGLAIVAGGPAFVDMCPILSTLSQCMNNGPVDSFIYTSSGNIDTL